MKKAIAILLLQLLVFSCMGQENKLDKAAYVQKLEYRLKGPVKEVTTYICNVAGDTIPTDTNNYNGKIMMNFDRSGNALAINKIWDFGSLGKSQYSINFSGKGRAVSFEETARINEGDFETNNFKYVWSDDYHYRIVAPEHPIYSTAVTLDNNYELIKTVFEKEDTVQHSEEWTAVYKDHKISEIESKMTEYGDGKETVTYQIQLVQQCDTYGNPTVIYGYTDRKKQRVRHVLYKKYKYYQ